MAGTTSSPFERATDAAQDLRDDAVSKAHDLGGRAGDAASDYGDAAAAKAQDVRDGLQQKTAGLRETASSIAGDLKAQAASHMDDAKGVVSSIADEARARIADIIDQQKAAGADKLSGLSRVAQNAASDLDAQNPHVARLVRDAAGSVDRIASDLRSSDLGEFVASVSSFARRQPVAFFAGSVLAGFALARFLKSEPKDVGHDPSRQS